MHEFKSVVIVRRKFRSKYPHCRNNIPSRKVIRILYSCFTRINKGNVHRQRPPVGPLIIETINKFYQENPSTSIRQVAQHVIICKTSVHKVVRKKIKLYPYKIQIVQSQEDPDYEKRESFARTKLDLINPDVTLPCPREFLIWHTLGFCKIKSKIKRSN